eukprot:TRINITY_DN14304_c0_g1_i1.p1 TRINITY_DN14304_c0_g1~~TRINITY_DN14304_c0_g1_i1.p1  ORF type:complete len:289 (-),score=52.11 TRINITY_DN14304_c0_g1_i1:871-1677(-)
MDTFVVIEAAAFLRMKDLATWRVVDTATKDNFDLDGEDNVWRHCANAQFGNNKLFPPYTLHESPHRQLFFSFHSLFQRANYMMSSDPLILEDVEDADLIERRLRDAFGVCSAHRSASGRDAQVLLGSFCVRGKKETMFRFGDKETSPTIAGLPPGVLAVKMRVQEGRLMIWAAYGELKGNVLELCQRAMRMQWTLNVSSADCDVSMSFRNVPLVLDGRWRSLKCPTSHCRSSETYTNWPVLCAWTLLEASPSGARPSLVNALSLDTCQ